MTNFNGRRAVSLDARTMAHQLGGEAHGTQISAPAPGHSKADRSLSVRVDPSAPDGFVVYGHAGEDPLVLKDHVRQRCNLDPWQPGGDRRAPEPVRLRPPAAAMVADPPKLYADGHLLRDGYRVAATYRYTDAAGAPLFEVLRYEHASKAKTFLQRHAGPGGRHFFGRVDSPPVLYRWPDLSADPSGPVYFCEGEKDVDRLTSLGLVATTIPGNSWPDDVGALKGRVVNVLEDNDDAGRKRSAKATERLAGTAKTVRIVRLPGLPEKGDVSNWLDAGGTVEDLVRICEVAPPEAANDNQPGRFNLTWFDDIAENKPKKTIIRGMLGEGEFSTLVGLPGTGKSVIATDACCHVAAGMEWHGRRVTAGLVVYVAAERKALTERRMLAFRKRHGVADVPLLVLGGRLDFTSSLGDAKALVAAVKDAEAQCDRPCVWIVIDTLTRTFGAGDQNASKDMTRFVQSCDEIVSATRAHVTVIHHTPWSGERGKGAIDLDGAVDASFIVRKNGTRYSLICDGTNDGEEGLVLAFAMESVTVGTDEDGEPTTAPVVVPADTGSPSALLAAIKGHNEKVLQALRNAVDEGGIVPEGAHFPREALVVQIDTWRQRFYADATAEKPDIPQNTLKQRFNRAVTALEAARAVEKAGQWVWIAT